MKYDQSVIDNTLDKASLLIVQGKTERSQAYSLIAIAMMMRNNSTPITVNMGYGLPENSEQNCS